MNAPIGPIDVVALEAANSRAYLRAVFQAWGDGQCVMALPEGAGGRTVPGIKVIAQASFTPDTGWFDETLPDAAEEAHALVAFSSGTTGRPKAILIAHRALKDVVDRINTAMEVDDTIREYLGVPVTYSFGFGRVRAVAAVGGKSFLPKHGFDPSEIGRMLAAGEINAVSAVPTLWRILLANRCSILEDAALNLKWIEIGSQWMTGAEKLELRRLFPKAKIVQHYGLTEASRSTLLDISAAPEDRLDTVGRPVGQTRIDIDAAGLIRTRGPHLAEGLITEAGVSSVVDDDGWLTTSDRGRLDDGWLYYEGRADELINSGGLKIDPASFEQAINSTLGVPGAVAASRMADPLRGEKVLVVLRQDAGLDRETVTQAIRVEATRIGLAGDGAFELREVAELPLTATGKVKRADLASLDPVDVPPPVTGASAEGAHARSGAGGISSPKAAELQKLWGEILGLETVPTNKGFYDLGGDSLSALTTILRMERLGIDADVARGIFEGKTISELAGEEPDAAVTGSATPPASGLGLTLTEAANSIHGARGVLVLWVVIVHWLPALLVRFDPAFIQWFIAAIPVWRLGTPGFAMVFGMGLGALGLYHYASNKERFLKNTWFNTKLVVGGVLVLALAKFLVLMANGDLLDRVALSGLFYSVISFYALALLTMPVIVWLLNRRQNRLLTIFSISAGSALIHLLLVEMLAHYQPVAALETAKLLLTAKYGYFRMLSFVMIGVAIGWLFRRHHMDKGIAKTLALYGIVLIAFGTVGTLQSETSVEEFGRTNLWHLSVYAGVVVLILAGFTALNRAGGPDWTVLRWFNAFFVASGILALPMFVGHEIIFAVKQLFDAFQIPDAASLAILLSVFFTGMFFAYRKLWPLLVR